jgi:hypothetical protein
MVHFIFFLEIKLFVCQDRNMKFQQLFDLGFRLTLQNYNSFRQTFRWHLSTGDKSCPNELKFCVISRNKKSKRCWKFQSSIMTNKKVLFLQKILSVPCNMDRTFFSQQMAPWRPNFPHQRLWFLLGSCLCLPHRLTRTCWPLMKSTPLSLH